MELFVMESIKKYFPQLKNSQVEALAAMLDLYLEWNEKINVISRKDMEHFVQRHLLHSLSILKVTSFKPGTEVMDVGTGGGFPGLPLAVSCPDVHFTLVDSIGKKIKVVRHVATQLGLANVDARQSRAEDMPGRYDFITSRAVKPLPVFYPWVKNKIKKSSRHELANGILYLKGGNLAEELAALPCRYQVYAISDFFSEAYFETKKIVHLFH